MHYQAILDFWFSEISPVQWFRKDPAFDQTVRQRFSSVRQAAINGELDAWRENIHGRLAEIIVIDQFSRNLFRENPAAFAADGMALVLAQELIRQPGYGALAPDWKGCALMPFMHSESSVIHTRALQLFAEAGNEKNLNFERAHKAIIDRFGRYPHRNPILNRRSTPEENEFIKHHKGF
ncbi:DUF924 family protein [Sodalis sp. RH21]|uniref:DUF924 family protein n=1 Tax=unclassified Sodalis (in: enterobacteria) TaxID=2636512 RepID=UPI0039B646CF